MTLDRNSTIVAVTSILCVTTLLVLTGLWIGGAFVSAKQEARLDLKAVTGAYTEVNAPSLTESLAAIGALKTNNGQPIIINRPAAPPLVLGGGVPTTVIAGSGHATNKAWAAIEACLSGLGLTPTTDFYSKVVNGQPRATLTAPGHAKVVAAGTLANAIACN